MDYRQKEEARIEKEKQLAAELEKKTNDLAQTGKPPPVVPVPGAAVPVPAVPYSADCSSVRFSSFSVMRALRPVRSRR